MRKIPSQFSLMGHTIKVIVREDLVDDADCYGRWHMTRHTIELQAVSENFTKSAQLQTFWHEVVHAILDCSGHQDLSADEALVDRVGQGIHQVLRTKR